MSSLSPLERLKLRHEEAQQARTTDVDIFLDGSLVARVEQINADGARDAMRTLMRLMVDDAGTLTDDELAGVLAAATRGLYARSEDGSLEPIVNEDTGQPMRFEPALSAALGFPELVEPADVVKIAFTEGDPPQVNSLRLLRAASQISMWLVADAEGLDPGH